MVILSDWMMLGLHQRARTKIKILCAPKSKLYLQSLRKKSQGSVHLGPSFCNEASKQLILSAWPGDQTSAKVIKDAGCPWMATTLG